MAVEKFRIVSEGGRTRAFLGDGKELPMVKSVKFSHEAGSLLMAEIVLLAVSPDVDICIESNDGR